MKAKIGVTCLTRDTYDYIAATELYQKTIQELERYDDIDWIIYDKPIMSEEEARTTALYFKENNVDGMVAISGTFHLGTLVLTLNSIVDNVPILLWAYPELPYDGGKIRLNSLCGVNLDASNMYKSNKNNFKVYIGNKIDDTFIKAVKIKSALKNAKIGILGHHAQGFYNIDVDEMSLYKNFGILVNHYELEELLNYAFEEKDYNYFYSLIIKVYDTSKLDEFRINKTAELCAKLSKFYNDHKLNGLAIRCWPEFANYFGIAPCASMSILQSLDYLLGCEGDIDGLISMIVHKTVDKTPPFLADLSQIDFEKNNMLLWHCGVAPYILHDKISEITLDKYFSKGRGVTAGFVLKSGRISMIRFDSISGRYRLFIGNGEIQPMKKLLSGTYGNCHFEKNVNDIFRTIVDNGCAHHFSTSYDHKDQEAIKESVK
ncbi:MAG: hypothetical protein MR210_02835 [Erysipelotrichaceae bacterium]|nr:hypothetical protein [Erysipelotrichaceae bacterium]